MEEEEQITESTEKDAKQVAEQQRLEGQLNELNEKLETLQTQFKDIVQTEEDSAASEFREISTKYEQMYEQLRQIEVEKNSAKAHWDEEKKKTAKFEKQIHSIKNEINKVRRKLGLEELFQQDQDKEYIIFKKDTFRRSIAKL